MRFRDAHAHVVPEWYAVVITLVDSGETLLQGNAS